MRAIGFDRHVLQSYPRGIMTCRDHLSGYFIGQVDYDLHGERITLAISRDITVTGNDAFPHGTPNNPPPSNNECSLAQKTQPSGRAFSS